MEFAFKEDWPQARMRLDAWWHGSMIDRVPVLVFAPRRGFEHEPPLPYDTLEQYWTDYDYIRREVVHQSRVRWFGGEAVPILTRLGNHEPEAPRGSRSIEYREDTVWYGPLIEDWCNVPGVTMKASTDWFKGYEEHYRRVVADMQGYAYVPIFGPASTGDTMSGLRGPERLCFDLVDNPELVKHLENEMMGRDWFEVYDRLWGIVGERMDGMGYWWLAWAPGRTASFQNDFSCMISADMYREFFLDNLVRQIRHVDYAMYHLDGPRAVQHLEALLDIKELQAIQFIPGSGHDYLEFLPLLKRISAAGKQTFCVGVSLKVMERLMDELPRERLLFSAYCGTQDEGEHLIDQVARLSSRRSHV